MRIFSAGKQFFTHGGNCFGIVFYRMPVQQKPDL
jgi:hypothetical protein